MKNVRGFTLVELVTVIILIGILAVSVLPKFGGSDSYEAHSHRTQLLSALRLTQQRAMQQTNSQAVNNATGFCHHIVFDSVKARYGVPDRLNCAEHNFTSGWQADKDLTGHDVDSRYNMSFAVQGQANPAVVSFDWMGRPTNDCAGGCTIEITNNDINDTALIIIEPEGYIHASN